MKEVEIDIQLLEDMCSELEEHALLVDRQGEIAWLNPALKNRLGFEIRDLKTDNNEIKKRLHSMFGDIFSNKLMSVFSTGRFSKIVLSSKSLVKIIVIPIKYGSEVSYALELIEELDNAPGNTAYF